MTRLHDKKEDEGKRHGRVQQRGEKTGKEQCKSAQHRVGQGREGIGLRGACKSRILHLAALLVPTMLITLSSLTGCSYTGRQSLYQSAEGTPSLGTSGRRREKRRDASGSAESSTESVTESATESAAESAAEEAAEKEEEDQERGEDAGAGRTKNWQAGWVRYKGKVYQYNADILTFLFLGIDKNGPAREGENGIDGGQADGQFLMVMNPHTKTIRIIAINRNTMTDVDVYNEDGKFAGTYNLQICLQHGYGDGLEQSCERAEDAVSNLFHELPIAGYVSLNMGGVAPLVDTVGSVTVPRLSFEDGKVVRGKDETLNGEEAYRYVHNRDKNVFDSASFRLEKQKVFLKSFLAKVKDEFSEGKITVMDLYSAVRQYTVTDLDISEIMWLGGQLKSYTLDDKITSLKGETIPAEEGTTGHEEFFYDEDDLYDLMIEIFYEEVE